jgi:hypothetical protein
LYTARISATTRAASCVLEYREANSVPSSSSRLFAFSVMAVQPLAW